MFINSDASYSSTFLKKEVLLSCLPEGSFELTKNKNFLNIYRMNFSRLLEPQTRKKPFA